MLTPGAISTVVGTSVTVFVALHANIALISTALATKSRTIAGLGNGDFLNANEILQT